MITQTLNLNLIPGGVLPRINVSQYDKGSRTLAFNIYNGATLFAIPSGSTITIQGTKPDHTAFQYSCEFEGSVVIADLEQQMTVLSGEVVCEIAINKDTKLIGTGNFILNVEPAAVADDTVISETELPLIEQAIEAASEAEASAVSAAESAEAAAAWSAHPPYIGLNGNWYVYDPETEQFVDTGEAAQGPQGETGQTGATGATPDITMTASADSTVGTPSVTVTESGTAEEPTFELAFHGLKGETGQTGATGATPDITMTASVDSTTGTPSVNVTESGTAEEPTIELEFSGIKGETGATGATGNGIANIAKTGSSGLVDTYTITYTNGDTDTFTVTNGRDGTGSGDMSASDYDSDSTVKNAGGIPDYITSRISGKQNVILASALPIGGTTETTVEGALGALNRVKQDAVLSSILPIGGQNINNVEDALSALNNVKQNRVLASIMTIGGQTVDNVEDALNALNNKNSGHIIEDENGTQYPERSILKFEGATITDDPTNNTTVVEGSGGMGGDIEEMFLNNSFYAVITDDNGDRLTDDSGNKIVGDWSYLIL